MNYQEIDGLARCGESWAQKLKAEHDAANLIILADRQEKLNRRSGVRVGDFVITPAGEVWRVAHHWGDCLQLAKGGSYYFTDGGGCSYSGGLEPGIDIEHFSETSELREGPVWFFSRNHAMAHNGWYTSATFKVWKLNREVGC